MFAGIVEGLNPIVEVLETDPQKAVTILVERPTNFDDIKGGDSIAVNGACLTVEKFTSQTMTFSLGRETLHVTGWSTKTLQTQPVNLERSLRLGDRIHGHWVSGHVDTVAKVVSVEKGASWIIDFELQNFDRRFVWPKGSIAINGVSLTINKITGSSLQVCLIPETLQRTNLQFLTSGHVVNIEYDSWAKAFVNYQEAKEATK